MLMLTPVNHVLCQTKVHLTQRHGNSCLMLPPVATRVSEQEAVLVMWCFLCRWWSRSWRTWASQSMSPESSTRCWSSPTVGPPPWVYMSSCRHVEESRLVLFVGYVTTIIEDAKIYSSHAKKPSVDADDIKLAIQCRMDQSFTSPPPRDVMNPGMSTAGTSVWVLGCWPLLCLFSSCWRWPDRRTRLPSRSSNPTPDPDFLQTDTAWLPRTTDWRRSRRRWGHWTLPVLLSEYSASCASTVFVHQVSSSASRISVPRLSVGAVTSRPTTPTLGEWSYLWFWVVSVNRTSVCSDCCRLNRDAVGPVCHHQGWHASLSNGSKVHRSDPAPFSDQYHQNR